MPFAPFVGVNHHRQSILLRCALISDEEACTFRWVFETWLRCIGNHASFAIITNQCMSMRSALNEVMPNTRHRWCLWHILKTFFENLRGDSEREGLKDAFMGAVFHTLSCDQFDTQWADMMSDYRLEHNSWIRSLFKDRAMWAPVYVRDAFWAGMSSTQRSESMNASLMGIYILGALLRNLLNNTRLP
ncbi:hypothetical protein ACOSQ3_027599 [Xanthoceras sorbifolium]